MTECFESTENLSEIYIFYWTSFPFGVEIQQCLFITKYCETKTSHLSN